MLTRCLETEDDMRKIHEYPASSVAAWVAHTGASYDAVPIGMAETKKWDRAQLREPVGINTANGETCFTHVVASRVPGMPEKAFAPTVLNTPMLISAGRRCLNRGYSLIWIAGGNPMRYITRWVDDPLRGSTWGPLLAGGYHAGVATGLPTMRYGISI